jgi:hypothetical protein
MAKSLQQLPRLARPVQTTSKDVLISGHGPYVFTGKTIIPQSIELWVITPMGASISDALGGALETGARITKLGVMSPAKGEWNPVAPTVYTPGMHAPNYTVYQPSSLRSAPSPGGPHLFTPEDASGQRLSSLWKRLQAFAQTGRTLRIFWAARGALPGVSALVVCHEEAPGTSTPLIRG